MSDNNETPAETTETGTEMQPGDVTEFVIALTQLDKGKVQLECTKALHEVVEAALLHEKKGGTMSLTLKVNPLDSGAVQIIADVKSNPVKDPAGTIFFADGEGNLSRDNAGMFYGTK